jgi:hypothetical protein
MKRALVPALAVLLSLTLPLGAAAAAQVTVSFDHWNVDTADGKTHRVGKGKTYRHCPAKTIVGIVAVGTVHNAHKGDPNRARWSQNGEKIVTFDSKWKTDDGTVRFGLTNDAEDVPNGTFGVKVLANGEGLASTHVRLAKRTTGC